MPASVVAASARHYRSPAAIREPPNRRPDVVVADPHGINTNAVPRALRLPRDGGGPVQLGASIARTGRAASRREAAQIEERPGATFVGLGDPVCPCGRFVVRVTLRYVGRGDTFGVPHNSVGRKLPLRMGRMQAVVPAQAASRPSRSNVGGSLCA